ncbi:MAG: dihydropteroate synthase [Verrucomicrobiota bacterium]|jgi:dihydropteroate synthase
MNANGIFHLRIHFPTLSSVIKMIWNIQGRNLDLTSHAQVMGILNVTPDSFSDGGQFCAIEAAITHARKMIAEGAAIIDIGGESTRPGALPVESKEEIRRTIPVIRSLRAEWDGLISIDTMKAAVAQAALDAGADIVNDVSGLTADQEMAPVCAGSQCGIVIMHMRGTPADMQRNPTYTDVVTEVRDFFLERLEQLATYGFSPTRLCFDPGIGFGKTLEHNLALLRHLDELSPADIPLLVGVSRKSLITKLTGAQLPADRDAATFALTAMARMQGVRIHRVHDVKGNLAALRTVEGLLGA